MHFLQTHVACLSPRECETHPAVRAPEGCSSQGPGHEGAGRTEGTRQPANQAWVSGQNRGMG